MTNKWSFNIFNKFKKLYLLNLYDVPADPENPPTPNPKLPEDTPEVKILKDDLQSLNMQLAQAKADKAIAEARLRDAEQRVKTQQLIIEKLQVNENVEEEKENLPVKSQDAVKELIQDAISELEKEN